MSEVFYRDRTDETSALDAGGQYDAGHGMRYTPYWLDEARTQLGGIWFWHPCVAEAAEFVGIGPNGRTDGQWTYTNTETPDKLTVRASILCISCQFHGFLTDGAWESV